jgi:nucleoside-diphosphate-sugar epimerase
MPAAPCTPRAQSLGKEAKIVLYSPEAIGTGKSGKAEGFPFRTIHFFASSNKAKRELGWKPAHDFLADADACVADYKASGRESKDIDFSIDDKILGLVGATA